MPTRGVTMPLPETNPPLHVCTWCNLWRATGTCGCCHRDTEPWPIR